MIVEKTEKTIHKIINSFLARYQLKINHAEREDLMQIAYENYYKYKDRHKEKNKAKLSTYISTIINRQLFRYLKKERYLLR